MEKMNQFKMQNAKPPHIGEPRLNSGGCKIGRVLLFAFLILNFALATRADILNTAAVSFLDATSQNHTALSNTVDITTASASLPAPDLPDEVLPINGQISFSYPVPNASFDWVFTLENASTQAGSLAASVSFAGPVSTLSKTTTAPRLNLAQLATPLSPGIYLVTIKATAGSQTSAQTTATLTLTAADLSTARVHPNPWRANRDSSIPITFDNLSGNTTVKIFTVSGHLVKTLTTTTGSTSWYRDNDSGDTVASGFYFYLITNDQGQRARGQLAIIR